MSAAAMHELASPLSAETELPGSFYIARKQEARDALESLLQLIASATPSLAIAIVLVDGDIERSIATRGLVSYANSKQLGMSPRVLNAEHTLVVSGAQLEADGVRLPLEHDWAGWTFALRRLQARWGNNIGVLWVAREQARPFLHHELTLIEQSAALVERELGFLARQEDIIVQRERATVELAQFHEQLHKQHGLYRELAKHLPGTRVLVFDAELRIHLNEGSRALNPLPPMCADGIGQHVAQCFAPNEACRIDAACRRALQGSHESLELHIDERTLELSVGPLRDASSVASLGLIVMRDVSEARKKHEQSTAVGARLQALVQSLDDGILVEDENRRVQVCSNRLCEIMRLELPSQRHLGCDGRLLADQMASICFIPEAFEESTAQLVDANESRHRELIYLADMRIIERDYSPLAIAERPMGHLWVYRDVTQREQSKDLLQRQADQLRALSLVDELTGLYNRRGFLTLATQQLKLCDRTMRPALVVFVDLDGMKRINDQLGHDFGDLALIETANTLRHCFRYSDVVARLGGDEFVALAIDAAHEMSSTIEQRLYEKLAELNAKPGRPFELQFSVGTAPYDPSRAEMIEEVLARADAVMYERKRARKARREA